MKAPRIDSGHAFVERRRLAAFAIATALLAAAGGNGGVEGRLASAVENTGNSFEAAAGLEPTKEATRE